MSKKADQRPVRKSRFERAVEVRSTQPQLSEAMTAIAIAFQRLGFLVDRSFEGCSPKGSGSVVGSVVQVPQQDPTHETHFEYLDAVRQGLESLVREAP